MMGVFDTFWFEKNLFGDIIAVYSDTGTLLVSYVYDAWGSVRISYHNGGISTGAQANSLMYRGYYYDGESELYYLNSRYYNPYLCRFISPDGLDVLTATPADLTDKNLYAYCDNNPVMRVDNSGEFWNILIGAGAGLLVGGVVSIVSQIIDAEAPSIISGEFWAHVGVAAGTGAISGGLAASGVGLVGQIVGNGILGAFSAAADTAIYDKGNTSVESYLLRATEGATIGSIAGIFGGKGSASKHVTKSFKRALGNGNWSYYFTQIKTQAKYDGIKAISGIVKATVPTVTKAFLKLGIQRRQ